MTVAGAKPALRTNKEADFRQSAPVSKQVDQDRSEGIRSLSRGVNG